MAKEFNTGANPEVNKELEKSELVEQLEKALPFAVNIHIKEEANNIITVLGFLPKNSFTLRENAVEEIKDSLKGKLKDCTINIPYIAEDLNIPFTLRFDESKIETSSKKRCLQLTSVQEYSESICDFLQNHKMTSTLNELHREFGKSRQIEYGIHQLENDKRIKTYRDLDDKTHIQLLDRPELAANYNDIAKRIPSLNKKLDDVELVSDKDEDGDITYYIINPEANIDEYLKAIDFLSHYDVELNEDNTDIDKVQYAKDMPDLAKMGFGGGDTYLEIHSWRKNAGENGDWANPEAEHLEYDPEQRKQYLP